MQNGTQYDPELNRRRQENALRRVTEDSEKQQNARIDRWLKLAEEMLQGDDPSKKTA